jgi:hypothetical protein
MDAGTAIVGLVFIGLIVLSVYLLSKKSSKHNN